MVEPPSSLPVIPVQNAGLVSAGVRPVHSGHRLAPAPPPGVSLGDVYFTLFRQKRRIALCTLLGLTVAAAIWLLHTPTYESEAKLFIRYVMENRPSAPSGDDTRVKALDSQGEAIISSELEIITSLDLLANVVDAIGPERIVLTADRDNLRVRALNMLAKNLEASVPPKGRVVHLLFKHPDQDIVQPVLRELIEEYLKKHVEIHRALGITGEFLTQETEQLRVRLVQTEEALRNARRRLGVASLEEARKAAGEQMTRLKQDIFAAEAEYAEHAAVLQQFVGHPVGGESNSVTSVPPTDMVDRYRQLDSHIALAQQRLQELRIVFTEDSGRLKELRADLAASQAEKKQMEAINPGLVIYQTPRMGTNVAHNSDRSVDIVSETARMRAVSAKLRVYYAQLDQIKSNLNEIEQTEADVQELRRKQQVEESNFRYFSASLDQARVDEALRTGHVSNISEIQSPSRPVKSQTKLRKAVVVVAVGGALLGLVWGFAVELLFDRTIKRPIEVERLLKLSLFLSIPDIGQKARRRPERGPNGYHVAALNGADDPEIPPWDPAHVLYPFHETLRDRLVAYFESIGLTHKPKLVAVTGVAKNSGVTTIAAGLAQRLSENGEGSVLLVDMTAGQGSAQQFTRGRPVCGLDEVLDTRDNAHVQEKLYVVVERSPHERLSRNLPQRFSKLVPKLKASDFDYIIFDMPPVAQISVTPRLASLMDMVLLVVEAERTHRDVVQRAVALLGESKVRLAAVLNRVHSYVPPRLYQESLSDS